MLPARGEKKDFLGHLKDNGIQIANFFKKKGI